MLQVTAFTFNPFSENTYIVSNENGDCILFDPGMYQSSEEQKFHNYIVQHELNPIALINTHCHIDHIFGNTFCAKTYELPLQTHLLEQQVLSMGRNSAEVYGLNYNDSVEAEIFLTENNQIVLGEDVLEILFTPGHSPGSLSFYSKRGKFVISGDVLFRSSIGRTDLPGGDHKTLIHSIKSKLLVLPDNTIVYSGHGPATNILYERENNPFLNA